jgi:predicted TPR repeat methyltransferase
MELEDRIRGAIGLHRQGELDAAEAAYRAILAEAPEQPDALHFLGLLTHDRGDAEAAIALIRRSVAACPGNAAAHNNLGNILKTLERDTEAAEAYLAAVKIDAGHADSWSNLGLLLRRARRMDKAVEVFRQAVRIAPGHTEAWHNLGMTLLMLGRLDEAGDAFEVCLGTERRRWSDPVWYAAILGTLGRHARAEQSLERHLALHPDDPLATHQLAALRGRPPDRAPDAYVRRHFDDFAGNFDEVLGWLDYRGPALVAEAVAARAGERAGNGPSFADLVDLGCGTGLSGPLVRRHAARLIGVDLSPGMLAEARRRAVYDDLVEYELVAFLRACLGEAPPVRFDLALCVDTLCYFGVLEPVMAALAPALKPGGAMIGTVERLEDGGPGGGPDYRIGPSGRYAHAEGYLRAAAGAAGLTLVSAERVELRKELDRDVPGLLFTIEHAGGS